MKMFQSVFVIKYGGEKTIVSKTDFFFYQRTVLLKITLHLLTH